MSHWKSRISLNWVTLQKNFMSWLWLIFDFKGGCHMTKFILRTFFTQTPKNFEKFWKICVIHTKFRKFLNSKFFRKNHIFVFYSQKYITFVWTKKNFFFDQKKFFLLTRRFVSFHTKFISELSDFRKKFYVMTRVNFWF